MTSDHSAARVRKQTTLALVVAALSLGACATFETDPQDAPGGSTANGSGGGNGEGGGDPEGGGPMVPSTDCLPTAPPEVPAPADASKPASECVADGSIKSAASGNWSDAATWSGGQVPGEGDTVAIELGHVVTFDVASARVAGINIACQSTLELAQGSSVTLESSGNVINEGFLMMRPSDHAVTHTLRFVDVDQEAFIGGGMDPLDTDVGLWVMGAGKLDFEGSSKTSWTNVEGSVAAGATSMTVADASGWQLGDEIMIVPTGTPTTGTDWDDATNTPIDPFAEQFERREITAIDGNTLSFAALGHDHAEVDTGNGQSWTAEVANLSRNVNVEGTAGGRAHIFIRSKSAQLVRYTAGRHLGPRQGPGRPNLVLGRYALHFHHSMGGSRGSYVEGNAFSDLGNRVFVPHMSDGVMFRCNIAFNTNEEAFWWDPAKADMPMSMDPISHDTVYDRNLMALNRHNGLNNGTTGMLLGQGDDNIAINNVAVYMHHGDDHARGAYEWAANNESVWVFKNNISHSNVTGLNVWQNSGNNHTVDDYSSYSNRVGIFHGAYANSYVYTGGYHYASPLEINAASGNSYGTVFKNLTFDAGGGDYAVVIQDSPIPSFESNKFIESDFRNYAVAGMHLRSLHPFGHVDHMIKHVDIIHSTFSGTPYDADVPTLKDGNRIRVQSLDGASVMSEQTGGQWVTSDIEPFAPSVFGTGTGLWGAYHNGSSFEELALERVDSMIMFQGWSYDVGSSPTEVHHLITGDAYSIRWTGKLEAQRDEAYSFRLQGASGFRLSIDGKVVLDDWVDRADNADVVDSTAVELQAGQKVDIQLEAMNEGGYRGCLFYWHSPSMGEGRWEIVPMHQLYPD